MNFRRLTIAVTTALLFFGALKAAAVIGINIEMNRSVYMQYEDVYACVTLRNDTGRAIIFGSDPKLQGFVLFDIRDSRGRSVSKVPGAEISVTGLVLNPGEIKRMVIPVNKYYNLDRPDTYTINTFISHNLLPNEYKSRDRRFIIDPGVTVWNRTIGIPDLSGKPSLELRQRTYSIRMLNEPPGRYYYLVIDDPKQVFGVMRLGRVYGQEKYQVELDMLSRIHLLIPLSPKIFHYLSFSLDGTNTANSYWKVTSTIPMLYRDAATGVVTRIGGEEAQPGIDFKDPEAGKFTASQLEELNDETSKRRRPGAPRNSGMVDIGKGVGN